MIAKYFDGSRFSIWEPHVLWSRKKKKSQQVDLSVKLHDSLVLWSELAVGYYVNKVTFLFFWLKPYNVSGDEGQRRIQDPVEHVGWSFLQK